MTDPAYFEDLFAASDDPWGHATAWYEARKYALTLAALPDERYRRCFEPGCGIGVLTAGLATRCDAVVSWDGSARALELARARVGASHVRFEQGRVPLRWPDASFDLVVCSELLYFLDAGARSAFVARTLDTLEPGGHLVAVHWRHAFDEAPSDGDEAHAELDATWGLERLARYTERDVVLDVHVRIQP